MKIPNLSPEIIEKNFNEIEKEIFYLLIESKPSSATDNYQASQGFEIDD